MSQALKREILSFYKRQNVDWASPFTVNLKGDAAIGDGVRRHFFSLVMEKLQFGFDLDLGDFFTLFLFSENVGKTLFFICRDDHQVPSTSRALVDGDLFQVVGRMIGHSFINGGALYTGMSQSLFPLMDINKELTPQDRQAINALAFSWDLPPVSDSSRRWLAETILQHGVIGRREKQVKQMRKGSKDTGVLPMLKERQRSCSPEMILKRVIWPEPDDDDADMNLEKSCQVTGFLRDYIQNGSTDELKELLRFWTGWTVLSEHLYVVVSPSLSMPTASTCLTTLKIPLMCTTYDAFVQTLKASVKSTKLQSAHDVQHKC